MQNTYKFPGEAHPWLMTDREARNQAADVARMTGKPLTVKIYSKDLNRWFDDFTVEPEPLWLLEHTGTETKMHGPFHTELEAKDHCRNKCNLDGSVFLILITAGNVLTGKMIKSPDGVCTTL